MTDAEMETFLRIVEVSEELVDAYEKAFRKIERSATGKDDLVVWVSAAKFRWLRNKFQLCWNKDAAVEAAMLQLRPKSTVFGPRDFEHLVQAILGMVDGRRYNATSPSHDGRLCRCVR